MTLRDDERGLSLAIGRFLVILAFMGLLWGTLNPVVGQLAADGKAQTSETVVVDGIDGTLTLWDRFLVIAGLVSVFGLVASAVFERRLT